MSEARPHDARGDAWGRSPRATACPQGIDITKHIGNVKKALLHGTTTFLPEQGSTAPQEH